MKDIYVVGTVNVGKSTFINRLIDEGCLEDTKKRRVTSSFHPGTTLNIIPFSMPAFIGCRVFDTPGVINENSITIRLTPREIKMLHPPRHLRPITYRLIAGKCIVLGAICRLELIEGPECGYFFTIFASTYCTIHFSDVSKIDNVIKKHATRLMWPPVDMQRMQHFQQEQKFVVQLEGIGRRASIVDIVFPGIGWIAVRNREV